MNKLIDLRPQTSDLRRKVCSLLSVVCCLLFISGCAKPLVDGRITAMKPVSREVAADPNTIYYAIKWAMDQCGYPLGPEDLVSGAVESKWVPVGAGSHYIDSIAGKDYGSNAAYYKMIVKIIPIDVAKSRVEAETRVDSIVMGMKSTGDKEREILEKIAEHSRGYNINVTNLGVEE